MWRISSSVGSYESGAVNQRTDVKTVQQMLAEAAKKLNNPRFHPGAPDGVIARIGTHSATVRAITAFQANRVRLARPDSRVDVNGQTWKTLVAAIGTAPVAAPRPVAGNITLTVRHGGLVPTNTTRQGTQQSTFQGMYESTFTLTGGLSGTFRGSIWPDDMTVKGRVVDGTYPLHIGFHKGGGGPKQGAGDLVAKEQGIRPGLLVNCRNAVPVQSDNPSKKTSVGINVHNGFGTKRFSDGCLTLQPSDWKSFIQKFLDGFPDINDWHARGINSGKQIGQLVIKP